MLAVCQTPHVPRKQIPSSVDAIRKDVESQPSAVAPDPQTTSGGSTLSGGPGSVQDKLRRKRLADKQSRTREKYLTRAKTFFGQLPGPGR